jgi:hypothetical protein
VASEQRGALHPLAHKRPRRPASACALLTPGSDAPPPPWPESTGSRPDAPRSGPHRRPAVVPAALLADLHDPRLILSDHYVGRDRRGGGPVTNPVDDSAVRTAPDVVARARVGREVPPLSTSAEPSSLAMPGLSEASPAALVGRTTTRRSASRRMLDILAILAIVVATVVPLALIGSHAAGQTVSAGNGHRKAASALGAPTRHGGGGRAARERRPRSTPARSAGRGATHIAGSTRTAVELSAGPCAKGKALASGAGCASIRSAATRNQAATRSQTGVGNQTAVRNQAAIRSQKAAARSQARHARRAAQAVVRTERRATRAGRPGSHRDSRA